MLNGRKEVIESVQKNASYFIELSSQYICNDTFVYSFDNNIVTCTKDGFDNSVGKCVKGEILLMFGSISLYNFLLLNDEYIWKTL